MTTDATLLELWLTQHDDESDDDYANRLLTPMPFIPTDEEGPEQ